MNEQTSRPWTWCDRRCDRCPILDECPEWEPASLDGEELANAGHEYLQELEAVGRRLDDAAAASELRLSGLILASKCARLTHALPLDADALDRDDTVLTLMVIHQLEKQANAVLMAAEVEPEELVPYQRARRSLRRRVDRQLEGVRESERAFLERMIMLGRAPSPFCVVITRT